jgi:hypothetical protein
MKQEIYQDGKLKMTLVATDGACDIVVMPKVLVKNCSMSAAGFDELFFTFLKGNTTHTQAYEQAEHVHEHYFGKTKYKDFDSFKCSKSYRHNKK